MSYFEFVATAVWWISIPTLPIALFITFLLWADDGIVNDKSLKLFSVLRIVMGVTLLVVILVQPSHCRNGGCTDNQQPATVQGVLP